MRKLIVIVVVVLAGVLNASDRPKALYKVLRISTTEVGIVCENGGDPTGKKIGQLLVISCGQ